ncbi:MAG: hypothetical protein E6R13_05340 [Spirochaetes bacterium]|nr:MAG: hypothetical protein E6R13_05340 [Spirochaetota bacterium]
MKQFIQKILSRIALSSIEGNNHSSARIQSYIILVPILVMCLIFVGFEATNFGICLYTGKPYVISTEIIVIFGMILSHHLAILFSRKKSQGIDEIKGTKKPKDEE